MKRICILYLITLMALFQLSCKKDYLDKKPNKALLVPKTFSDFQSLLDYSADVMNYEPTLQMTAIDDFYTTSNGVQGLSTIIERNSYTWEADIYQGRSLTEWNRSYQQIFYSNVVLDGLAKMEPADKSQAEWKNIKGAALFYRSLAFYNLAQLFAAPYDLKTAGQILGVPLRLNSDINEVSKRGTLQQTYDRIIEDLLLAKDMLPLQQPVLTRPVKNAAVSLLARVHLTMEVYDKAALFADESLLLNNKLIDYNTLNPNAVRPFPVFLPDNKNVEVIFYSRLISYSYLTSALTYIDPALYNSYVANDLRKTVLFADKGNGNYAFKGSYAGSSTFFGGLTTGEMYLIKAECLARKDDAPGALNILNNLLEKRWKQGTFIPLSAANAEEALFKILTERRKDLVGRGYRWTDLRRLNKDPRFAVSLKRNVNGIEYSLLPNDKRYVFAIPDNELNYSRIEQNLR